VSVLCQLHEEFVKTAHHVDEMIYHIPHSDAIF